MLSRYGYSIPAFAAAGLALLAALCAAFLLPESHPKAARLAAAKRSLIPALPLAVLRRPAVGTVLLLFFLGTLCFSALEGTFALFGEHRYQIGPSHVGYVFALVGTLSATMQLGFVGWLARRFGERALVLAGFLAIATGMIGAGIGPPLPLMLAAMGVVAIGNGLTAPSLAGLVSIATSREDQGETLGAYQSLGSLGRSAGPFLGGLAFDHLGVGSPFWLGGIVTALSCFLAWKLPRRRAKTVDMSPTAASQTDAS